MTRWRYGLACNRPSRIPVDCERKSSLKSRKTERRAGGALRQTSASQATRCFRFAVIAGNPSRPTEDGFPCFAASIGSRSGSWKARDARHFTTLKVNSMTHRTHRVAIRVQRVPCGVNTSSHRDQSTPLHMEPVSFHSELVSLRMY